MKWVKILGAALALAIGVVGSAAPSSDEEKPQTLYWEALMPEGEWERLNALQAAAGAGGGHNYGGEELLPNEAGFSQVGTFNVVEALDGERVRLPGFVLPFEYSETGMVTEFLLVPYFGACIHVPPPPPNQMVYVTAAEPAAVGNVWSAVWVTGRLRTERHINDLGNAAYTLELESWEAYDGA